MLVSTTLLSQGHPKGCSWYLVLLVVDVYLTLAAGVGNLWLTDILNEGRLRREHFYNINTHQTCLSDIFQIGRLLHSNEFSAIA